VQLGKLDLRLWKNAKEFKHLEISYYESAFQKKKKGFGNHKALDSKMQSFFFSPSQCK